MALSAKCLTETSCGHLWKCNVFNAWFNNLLKISHKMWHFWIEFLMYLLSKTWRPPDSIPVILKTVYKFTPPHRHDAGAVCVRPVAAPHHRTDPWRLPLRELWRFLHRDGAVCGERGCVSVPATATPQQETRKQSVKLIHFSLSAKKHRRGNRGSEIFPLPGAYI